MGAMGQQTAQTRSEEYLEAAQRAFARCPSFSGLRLQSIEARHGFVMVKFEGRAGDYRGPYGVVVRLPQVGEAEAGEVSVEDWARLGVVVPALEAYKASQGQERPYSPDGVWLLQSAHGQSAPKAGS